MGTPSAARSHLLEEVGELLSRRGTAADVVDLVVREGWLPPAPATGQTETLSGVLRDGRRVPVRVQHSLLTGVTSGSI